MLSSIFTHSFRVSRTGAMALSAMLMAVILVCLPASAWAQAAAPLPTAQQPSRALWTTVPFVRGQDLCQYEDAYGRSRSALRQELTREVRQMMLLGAAPVEAAAAVVAMDGLIDKNRRLATAGMGMDVLLEGSIKAQLDRIYGEIRPQLRAIRFHNPATLIDILHDVREQRRQGQLNAEQLRRIDGLMWGTYSYAPGCRGEVVVSLHVEMRDGSSVSFGCTGRPEHVAAQLASQVFQHFQGTRAPSTVVVDGQRLAIVGAAPGRLTAQASSLGMAQAACRAQAARLPTLTELEQIGLLGPWNGGVQLGTDGWLLPDGRLYVPSMPRPSPVRSMDEMGGDDFHFFCVR